MRNVMLQNSINLMVQPEFSPVNCPLSSAFVNICQNLSFESLRSKVSLLSKVWKKCFVFTHSWLFSQNNQPNLDWKFKNDWTKNTKKNKSFTFLAKRKLTEKNDGFSLTNQVRSRMLRYTSQIAEEAPFFSVTLFGAWFYDNQFNKTKFNLLKILEVSQEHARAMLVKLQSFVPQFNQFHPNVIII